MLEEGHRKSSPIWYVEQRKVLHDESHVSNTIPNLYSGFGESGGTAFVTDGNIYATPYSEFDDEFLEDGSDFSDPPDDQIDDEEAGEGEQWRRDTDESIYEIPFLGDGAGASPKASAGNTPGASPGAKQTPWSLSTSPKPNIISLAKVKAGHGFDDVKNTLPPTPPPPPPAKRNDTNQLKGEIPKGKVALHPPRKQQMHKVDNSSSYTEQTKSKPSETGLGRSCINQSSPQNLTGTDSGLSNELAMKFAKRANVLNPPDGKGLRLKATTQEPDKANDESNVFAKKKALVPSHLLKKGDRFQPSDKPALPSQMLTKLSSPKPPQNYENADIRSPTDVKPNLRKTKPGNNLNTRGEVERDVHIPRRHLKSMAGTVIFIDKSQTVVIDKTDLREYLQVGDQVLQISGIDVRNSSAAFVTECWKRVIENPVRVTPQ